MKHHENLVLAVLLVVLENGCAKPGNVALPSSGAVNQLRSATRGNKEEQLRQALGEIRDAISEYKKSCMSGMVGPVDRRKDDLCYPPRLEFLVDGIRPLNKNYFIQFLKRIPVDPITGKAEWDLRSAQDTAGAKEWGGQNVMNVHSKSKARASNGTSYHDW